VTQIRVFLADDHPIARGGLRGLLEAAVDIEVVGEADDGTEALRLVQLIEPDVLLLDMEMPGLTGVEVAQQLRAVGSSVRILVLSAHDDPMYIKGLFGLGVEGYLVKEEILSTIVEAIRGVVQGEKGWVSRQVAAQLSTWVQNGPQGDGLRDEWQLLIEAHVTVVLHVTNALEGHLRRTAPKHRLHEQTVLVEHVVGRAHVPRVERGAQVGVHETIDETQ
jgi:YesN/AraC family two-component response regulator